MRVIQGLELGDIVSVAVKDVHKDGRKVPDIDLAYFMQLNRFNWRFNLYPQTIFTYNPYKRFPISKKSILDAIGPEEFNERHYNKSEYVLEHIQVHELDPLFFGINCYVVFCTEIPNGEMYFQCNHPNIPDDEAALVKIQKEDFMKHLENSSIPGF